MGTQCYLAAFATACPQALATPEGPECCSCCCPSPCAAYLVLVHTSPGVKVRTFGSRKASGSAVSASSCDTNDSVVSCDICSPQSRNLGCLEYLASGGSCPYSKNNDVNPQCEGGKLCAVRPGRSSRGVPSVWRFKVNLSPGGHERKRRQGAPSPSSLHACLYLRLQAHP